MLSRGRELKYLDQSEVERFFSAIPKDNVRDRLLFLMIYRYGMRTSEACRLPRGAVDLEAGTITIRGMKGGLERTFTMDSDVQRLVGLWRPTSHTFFHGRQGPLSRQRVWELFKLYLRRSGLVLNSGYRSALPLSDKGTLQSFVVADVAPPGYEVPHAQGYIDLFEDGPHIFSLLADHGDGAELRIGSEVGLKIIKRGSDEENRIIVGYRFTPLPQPENKEK